MPLIISGITMLALAVIVAAFGRQLAAARILVALLVLRGASLFNPHFWLHGESAIQRALRLEGMLEVSLPFVAIAFALAFPRQPQWLQARQWLWSALPVVHGAMIAALVVNPGLFSTYHFANGVVVSKTHGWLWPWVQGQFVIFAVVGTSFAWRARDIGTRAVALAFLLQPAFSSTWALVQAARQGLKVDVALASGPPVDLPFLILHAIAIMVVLGGAILLRRFGAVAAIAAATGAVVAWWDPALVGSLTVASLLEGVWRIAMPLMAGYGMLWHSVAGIDLNVRAGVRRVVVVAAYLAVFAIASQVARIAAGDASATTVGYVAVGALALTHGRVDAAAQALAAHAIPTPDAPGHLDERRLHVYRAALAESRGSRRDADRLEAMRRRLGLTERDHALLVATQGADSGLGVGSVVGGHRIQSLLGQGGNGRAWLAHGPNGSVVIKEARATGHHRARLIREARTLKRLSHANILPIMALHTRGTLAIVAPYGGQSLDQEKAPITTAAAIDITRQVLAGLAASHAAGVIHRDLKPANILLQDGHVRICDFGIAHDEQAADATLTSGGPQPGTLRYMAPEQIRGGEASAASDVWSAGIVLYWLLTGEHPLVDKDTTAYQARIAIAEGMPRGLPRHFGTPLADAVAAMLASRPTDRPTAADAVALLNRRGGRQTPAGR